MPVVQIAKVEYPEVPNDVTGLFDEKGNLIHSWPSTAMCWHVDLKPILEHFGINVEYPEDVLLEKKLADIYREGDEEDE